MGFVFLAICVSYPCFILAGGPRGDDCNGYRGPFYKDDQVKCSNEFHECMEDGSIVNASCMDPDMVLHPEDFKCDLPASVVQCETDVRVAQDLNCTEDGVFSNPTIPCSIHYYACSNGSSETLMCSRNGTRFDSISGSCLFRPFVQGCGGFGTTPPPQDLPTERIPVSAMDCNYLPDGDYANPLANCSQYFISCASGRTIVKMCSQNTKYDVISNRCLFKEHVEPCGGKATLIPPIANVSSTGQPSTSALPFEFNCTNVADGSYPSSDGVCSEYFAQCSGGRFYPIRCHPADLKYDNASQSCQEEGYVDECNGNSTTTLKYAPSNTTLDLNATTTPSTDIPYNCTADGDYENPLVPCSAMYVSCSGNRAFTRICNPDTLRFDETSKSCLQSKYVAWCGGTATSKAPASNQTSQPPPEFNCMSLSDGFYPDPLENCSDIFYSCSGERVAEHVCPNGTFFDDKSTACLHSKFVEICGGNATEAPVIPTGPPPTPSPYDCQFRDDGNYEHPKNACHHLFYACVGNVAFERKCDEDLRYEPESDSCQVANFVRACGGTPTKKPPIPTENIPSFNCTDREMGNHANPEKICSSMFFSCNGGQFGIHSACPQDTFFDKEFNLCDFFDNIPDCSGHPRPSTTIKANVTTAEPSKFDCVGKEVGNHGDPLLQCSPLFYTCAPGGIAFDNSCPGGTFFDTVDNLCNFHFLVPECSGPPRESSGSGSGDLGNSGSGSTGQGTSGSGSGDVGEQKDSGQGDSGSGEKGSGSGQEGSGSGKDVSGSGQEGSGSGQNGSGSGQDGSGSGQDGSGSGQDGSASGQDGSASGQDGSASGQDGSASGQDGSGSGQDGSGSGQDGSGSGQEGSGSGQNGSGSGQDGSGSGQDGSGSGQDGSGSGQDGSGSGQDGSASGQDGSASGQDGSASGQDGSGSGQEGSGSGQNGSGSGQDGSASGQNGSASGQDGSGSGQDGSGSGQDGSGSGQDGSASGQDGSASGQDGSASGQDGSASGQDGSASGQDGSGSGQDGSGSGQDGSASGQDGSGSGQDGSGSGQDGSGSGQDGSGSGQNGSGSGQDGSSSGDIDYGKNFPDNFTEIKMDDAKMNCTQIGLGVQEPDMNVTCPDYFYLCTPIGLFMVVCPSGQKYAYTRDITMPCVDKFRDDGCPEPFPYHYSQEKQDQEVSGNVDGGLTGLG